MVFSPRRFCVATYSLRRFIRPETLRAVDPASRLVLLRPHRQFFSSVGFELPAARDASALDLQKLAGILATPDLRTPIGLADALYYINELATRDDALLSELAPDELGLDLFHIDPADVALRAWVKDRELV
jgi:hypothetical protein